MLALVQSIVGIGERDAATSDARLVQQARGGDREALGALYRRHSSLAFTLALRLTGDRDRAHDVLQDAFLRAFDRLDSYRSDAPFSAWLKRIVVNVSIDRARSERLWRMDEPDFETMPAREVDPGAQHDAIGLLARLPPAARTVLVLYTLEGHSHQEIAQLLGRTEAWSKTVLSRARARLASWVETEKGA